MRTESTKQTILIVDDTLSNVKLLERILASEYDTVFAVNGPQALEFAQAHPPPDLILLDIMMPEMDGYEVCQRLKSEPHTKDIPIIFVTAKIEARDETRGLELGAVDYITKPLSPVIVKARIKTHLEQTRVKASLSRSEKEFRQLVQSANSIILRMDKNGKITFFNRYAERFFGYTQKEIIGRDILGTIMPVTDSRGQELKPLLEGMLRQPDKYENYENENVRRNGDRIWVSWTNKAIRDEADNISEILCIGNDITSIRDLLEKQEISIDLAKKILKLVNRSVSRNIDIGDQHFLFVDAIGASCCAEGGDHLFVNEIIENNRSKTVVSLKDQSGHEVGCILRSIATDLIHNALLARNGSKPLEKTISELNTEICKSALLAQEDFFSSITAEIDHETRVLRYVSAGHPPFLLIRNGAVLHLPESEQPGANVPLGFMENFEYSAGTLELEAGDRLIFYTDGLTEMPSKNRGAVFTIEKLKRMVEGILQTNPTAPVTDMLWGLVNAASELSGETVEPPFNNTSGDDVTLIGLEIEKRNDTDDYVFCAENTTEVSDKIAEIYNKIQKEWHRRKFETPIDHVRVALQEAVLNAWKHGNRKDPGKEIRVQHRFGNDFHLDVVDKGEGFDYRSPPDPTSEDNLTRLSGRGLFLIRYYADDVGWRNGGSQIRMSFKKSPDDKKRTLGNHRFDLW